ncbi:unnamed protein product [Caenorhabditis nigoni]
MMNGFSSVIVVLNLVSISHLTNFGLKSINVHKTENQFLDNPATPLDLSFVRNSIGNSPTPEVIKDLACLARIVTAITIPIGLSDGSIPEDNFIAELYNIEPGDVRILESFKEQYSELLFNKLKDMKPSSEVTKVIGTLVKMFEFMELWKSVDMSNLPDDESFAKLEDLKSIDVSGMKDINISDIRSVLQTHEADKFNSSLKPLVTAVESIKVTPDEFIPTLEMLKPLSSLGRALNLYSFIGQVDYDRMLRADQESLKKDFESLKKLKEITLPPSLDATSRFILSRFMHRLTNKTYTAGFVNGFKDVDTLKTDRLDKWVQEVVQRDLSSLKEFDRLGIEVVELDDHWKSVTYNTYTSLKLISDLCKLIAREPPSHDEVLSVMNGITSCAKSLQPQTVTEINQLAGYAGILLKKLSAIKRMRESMRIINLKIIPRLSKKISVEELNEMKKILRKLETDARIVQEGHSFDQIDMMVAGSSAMRIFQGEHEFYTKSFDCITKLGPGFENVTSAARALMKIDQVQKNHTIIKDVQDTYEASTNTAKTLELIRLVLRNIKTYVDPKLTNLTDLKNVSKPFGEAVAALVLSDVVSRRSLDFETFVNDGYSIENQVDKHYGMEFKNEFRKEWGDFQTTAQNINSMFVGITAWMETIKGPNASLPIEEAGLIFQNFTDFVDVDMMTLHRLAAIASFEKDQLTTLDQKKQLEEFRKSLIDLSRLDLNFARFQNSTIQMPETLDLLLDILYVEGIESFTARWKPLKMLDLTFLFGFLIMFYLSLWSVPFSYRNMKKSYKRDIQRRSEKKLDGEEPEDNDFSEFEYDLEEIMVFYDEEMPESVHEDHEQITVRERAKEPEPLDDEAKDFSPDLLELYALYGHDKDGEEPSEPSTDEYFGTSSREPQSQSWFHLISQDSLGPPPSIISTYSLHD